MTAIAPNLSPTIPIFSLPGAETPLRISPLPQAATRSSEQAIHDLSQSQAIVLTEDSSLVDFINYLKQNPKVSARFNGRMDRHGKLEGIITIAGINFALEIKNFHRAFVMQERRVMLFADFAHNPKKPIIIKFNKESHSFANLKDPKAPILHIFGALWDPTRH